MLPTPILVSSSSGTSCSTRSPGSSPNSAAQERDSKVARIPSVVLVEDGRQDSEGILLVKGGFVTSPTNDSSLSIVPIVTQTASKTAIMTPAKSSLTENAREEVEGNGQDSTAQPRATVFPCDGCSTSLKQSSDSPREPSRLRNTSTPCSCELYNALCFNPHWYLCVQKVS